MNSSFHYFLADAKNVNRHLSTISISGIFRVSTGMFLVAMHKPASAKSQCMRAAVGFTATGVCGLKLASRLEYQDTQT